MRVRFQFVMSRPKEPAKQSRNTSPLSFAFASPGQQLEAILPEVSFFNSPTGERIKDVAGY